MAFKCTEAGEGRKVTERRTENICRWGVEGIEKVGGVGRKWTFSIVIILDIYTDLNYVLMDTLSLLTRVTGVRVWYINMGCLSSSESHQDVQSQRHTVHGNSTLYRGALSSIQPLPHTYTPTDATHTHSVHVCTYIHTMLEDTSSDTYRRPIRT